MNEPDTSRVELPSAFFTLLTATHVRGIICIVYHCVALHGEMYTTTRKLVFGIEKARHKTDLTFLRVFLTAAR